MGILNNLNLIREKKRIYNIYCDESSVDNPKSKFMVIGSLYVERNKAVEIKNKLKEIRKEYHINGELKWTKTSSRVQLFYKALFDYIFSLPESSLSYRCIVINKENIDYKKYHQQDKDLAFYKFYYYLFKNKLSMDNEYYIFVDFKPSIDKNAVRRLGEFLSFTKSIGKIKHIQAYPSNDNIFIQVSDILTGAVSFAKNKIGTSQNKKKLSEIIASSVKKDNLDFCSVSCNHDEKFNIFCIMPKEKEIIE